MRTLHYASDAQLPNLENPSPWAIVRVNMDIRMSDTIFIRIILTDHEMIDFVSLKP